MRGNPTLLLGLFAIAGGLSGCIDPAPAPLDAPAAPPSAPTTEFQWSTSHPGDVSLAFTIEPARPAQCVIDASYTPSPDSDGFDGLAALVAPQGHGWMITGSAMHHAYAHAGPLDSRDGAPASRDEGPIPLGGEFQLTEPTRLYFGVEGDEDGSASRTDEHPSGSGGVRFSIKARCGAGAVFSQPAVGHEFFVEQSTESSEGVGAALYAPATSPGISVSAATSRGFESPEVAAFVGGIGEGYSAIEIEGPEIDERYSFAPSLEETPWAEVHGGRGPYTFRVPVDADLSGGLWYAALGLKTLASFDELAAVA